MMSQTMSMSDSLMAGTGIRKRTRAGRLIRQGEWEQAGRLLGVAAPDAARARGAERLALVKAMLEMLRGDADIAGRILAEVKARLPE